MTKLTLYDYDLPENLIAQYPADVRDGSRLLVINRADGSYTDRHFSDIVEYFSAGDLLVMNDSRVIHARLIGEKCGGGARIELFLLRERGDGSGYTKAKGVAGHGSDSGITCVWEVLARPARRLKPGDRVLFGEELVGHVLEKAADGSLLVAFECVGGFEELIERVGKVPLPPYIRREAETVDADRYQTVYAKNPGSAAAPTAGLHFTEELLGALRAKGVQTVFVTLHVGLGTFRPVQTEEIEDHHMHEEFYHIEPSVALAINLAKDEGRRVICVGTTSVRTLESAAAVGGNEETASIAPEKEGRDIGNSMAAQAASVAPGWGSTELYIYPGSQKFRITDALITNFHLPKSTLLMLVSAFYDREKVLEAYQHAIAQKYRFFSYGDAMLIL